MIFFIAPNPHTNKREGFLQRVYAIDQVFQQEEKMYIDDCKSEADIVRALAMADVVYIHSMYQANRIKEYVKYFAEKIVVDLHGVVPEELEYMGDKTSAKQMEGVERVVFSYVKCFIAVTDTMVRYYRSKYPVAAERGVRWITLPIFDSAATKESSGKDSSKSINIIYAGGTQKWQSVDKMIETMKRYEGSKRISFTVLSHDKEVFNDVAGYSNVNILSVAPNEVIQYYSRASLGFILRDKSIVNQVACPTKLIEYFEHNIVPVVDNEQIGDFKDLGYKYINYRELNETISHKKIHSIAQHNRSVVDSLIEQSNKGKKQLVGVVGDLKTKEVKRGVADLLAVMAKKITKLDSVTGRLQNDLDQKLAENQIIKSELDAIKSSKKWRLVSGVVKIIKR